jgi:hypothetical protein
MEFFGRAAMCFWKFWLEVVSLLLDFPNALFVLLRWNLNANGTIGAQNYTNIIPNNRKKSCWRIGFYWSSFACNDNAWVYSDSRAQVCGAQDYQIPSLWGEPTIAKHRTILDLIDPHNKLQARLLSLQKLDLINNFRVFEATMLNCILGNSVNWSVFLNFYQEIGGPTIGTEEPRTTE